MKKKRKGLVVILAMVLSLALCLGGCGDNVTNDDLKDKNLFSEVCDRYYRDNNDVTVSFYKDEFFVGWAFAGQVTIDSLDLLLGEDLPMNNYGMFRFEYKTNKYKITKIEFDVLAEADCTLIFSIYITKNEQVAVGEQYKYQIKANTVQHVVFTGLALTSNQEEISIRNTPKNVMGSGDYEEQGGYTTNWKMMNLKMFGEKA